MITVGLDFGTHQTKICIEEKNGVETHYSFHKFTDNKGEQQYTLPSVVGITPDNRIMYGYIEENENCQIKRYFKQAVYKDRDSSYMTLWDAARYSIWYLAYILFDLEEEFGKDFTVQMGAPTDSDSIDETKAIAVSLLASAYRLVEDVFHNDKNAFLQTNYVKLIEQTNIIRYSSLVKRNYGILVFPEAYACLMPLIGRGKISKGMNLIVDIGGGTTDISFFTIENKKKNSEDYHPQVYDFFSINKGLNYLTEGNPTLSNNKKGDIHFYQENELDQSRINILFYEIIKICQHLTSRLKDEWSLQTDYYEYRLTDALKNRPIVYTGGGSTIMRLQRAYEGFKEIHLITYDSWKSKEFVDKSLFQNPSLCPILSTAYGLSISVKDDIIVKKPFRDIFKNARGGGEEKPHKKTPSFGKELGGFEYGTDYDAWK